MLSRRKVVGEDVQSNSKTCSSGAALDRGGGGGGIDARSGRCQEACATRDATCKLAKMLSRVGYERKLHETV